MDGRDKSSAGAFTVKKMIAAVLLIALILVSIFVVGKNVCEPEFSWNAAAIENLDAKKTNVLKFTGISAGLSTALTMIPGDIGTPVANELAQLTSYFLAILSAITAEKYIVTLAGFAAFYIFVPAGLFLIIVNMFSQRINFARIGSKLITFGILFYLLVPISCTVSDMIEDTYSDSITTAEAQSVQALAKIEEFEDDALFDKVKNAYSTLKDTLENALNRQMEVVAIMAVTCCIIPVAVIFIFIWLMKTVLNVPFKEPDFRKAVNSIPKVNGPARKIKGKYIRISSGNDHTSDS